MKKTTLLTSLTAICLSFFLVPQTVQAAGFVQDTTGVKYQNDDGSYLLDSWVQVGNSIYRLDANGNVIVNCWVQIGSLWYQFDAAGICLNPAGSASAPASTPAAASAQTSQSAPANNIYSAAGWVPFTAANTELLQAGIAAGLVGSDGAQFWAEPTFAAQAAALAAAPAVPQASKTVYWTPKGKSYHSTPECPTLSRSKTINEGTLENAYALGKSDSCDRCH